MTSQKKAEGFIKFGEHISSFLSGKKNNAHLTRAIKYSYEHNGWFTEENVHSALSAISEMLAEKNLLKFLNNYQHHKSFNSGKAVKKKSVAVIMPSNIPLAGFHDFFCVLMSGNIFIGKCSLQDKILLPALAKMLIKAEPAFNGCFYFVDNFFNPGFKAQKPDFFIATGSNNSARYFEYYFGKYPHIIRKNRNSIAILTGRETIEDLSLLANDIFLYFGLGCRNISKIFIPENYDFKNFFKGIFHWKDIIQHNKYANNYTYHKAVLMMNKINIRENGFLLLIEEASLSSPVAVIHYEFYKDIKFLTQKLCEQKNEIQCIASNLSSRVPDLEFIPFGKAQAPQLWDYADGIDTMKALLD